MKKKKILITGADGQLGSNLSAMLSGKFYSIPTSRTNKDISYCLDVTDRSTMKSLLKEWDPDVIINCAAMTDVDYCENNRKECFNVNVKGLQNLISLSNKETFIIQLSTDYVFDGKNSPYGEKDHPSPLNYYGHSKLEAENILRGSRRKYLIVRANVIYGRNMIYNSFFSWVYKSLSKNKIIYVVDDQISNPSFVDNLSDLIFKSLLLNFQGIVHHGSSDNISRYEFAKLIAKVYEFDENLIKPISTSRLIDKNKSYVAKRPLNSALMIDKSEKILNAQILSLEYSLNIIKQQMNQ